MGIKQAAVTDGRINRIPSMPHAPCPMPNSQLPTDLLQGSSEVWVRNSGSFCALNGSGTSGN